MAWTIELADMNSVETTIPFYSDINYYDSNGATNNIIFTTSIGDIFVMQLLKNTSTNSNYIVYDVNMKPTKNSWVEITAVTGIEETGQTTNGFLQILKDGYTTEISGEYRKIWYKFFLSYYSATHWQLKFLPYQYALPDDSYVQTYTIANTVTVHCLEFKPHLLDEGKQFKYWTGKKSRTNVGRWAFSVECYPFTTQGDYTGLNGFEKYYTLSKLLLSENLLVLSVDSEFERMNNYFTFPLYVVCTDSGDLGSNKEANQNTLSFTLEQKYTI